MYSLEGDILPVITAKNCNGFKPASWRYYVPAVQQSGDNRKAIASEKKPAPASVDEAKMWQSAVAYFVKQGSWHLTRQRVDDIPVEFRHSIPDALWAAHSNLAKIPTDLQ